MPVAALYDVHGNLAALDAVLAEVPDDATILVGGDVVVGHVEPEDERAVVLLDLLDAHGVGLVDEPARELGDQLRHAYWMP